MNLDLFSNRSLSDFKNKLKDAEDYVDDNKLPSLNDIDDTIPLQQLEDELILIEKNILEIRAEREISKKTLASAMSNMKRLNNKLKKAEQLVIKLKTEIEKIKRKPPQPPPPPRKQEQEQEPIKVPSQQTRKQPPPPPPRKQEQEPIKVPSQQTRKLPFNSQDLARHKLKKTKKTPSLTPRKKLKSPILSSLSLHRLLQDSVIAKDNIKSTQSNWKVTLDPRWAKKLSPQKPQKTQTPKSPQQTRKQPPPPPPRNQQEQVPPQQTRKPLPFSIQDLATHKLKKKSPLPKEQQPKEEFKDALKLGLGAKFAKLQQEDSPVSESPIKLPETKKPALPFSVQDLGNATRRLNKKSSISPSKLNPPQTKKAILFSAKDLGNVKLKRASLNVTKKVINNNNENNPVLQKFQNLQQPNKSPSSNDNDWD